jgi:uncharacterized protein (DUF1800 family)
MVAGVRENGFPEARARRSASSRFVCFAGSLLAGVALSVAATASSNSSDLTDRFADGPGPASWVDDLRPIGKSDWSYARAAHLLERAGFGGTPEEIEVLAAMTPEQAVSYLVDYETIDASALPEFVHSGIWTPEMLPDVDDALTFREGIERAVERGRLYDAEARDGGIRPMQAIIDVNYYRNYATRHEWLRAANWWAERMMLTPRPLEEKMTLFWHGHFATEQEKVRDYRLMLDQMKLLRRYATGNFRSLLLGISRDPAMLVYLDNRLNVVGNANENFAREIMELFGLGVGNYTENDIKEAARAFTGWRNFGPRFIDDRSLHDELQKTVLGQTGNWDGEDVVDILLEEEVCARFIAAKIYRFFVRDDLSAQLEAELARVLRDSHYEIKPLLRTLFSSRDFYASASYGTRIKGPVEFLVSTFHKMGLDKIPGTPYFPLVSSQLGQALGDPPNVAGWDGGRAWINPSTLIERGNVLRYVLFPELLGDAYRYGPFEGRYQRYQFAPKEVFERDRVAAFSGGAAAGASSSMAMENATPAETMASPTSPTSMNSDGGMMAPSAAMINETPQYDLPFGVYNGMNRAFHTVRPVDQEPVRLNLAGMLEQAGVETAGDAVGYLIARFLPLGLEQSEERAMTRFLTDRLAAAPALDYQATDLEQHLREVLHLILSTPEYQLS